MARYHKLGKIPQKRHVQFRNSDGKLYSEELISTIGFDSVYSLVYHCNIPTAVKEIEEPYSVAPEIAHPENLKSRKYFGLWNDSGFDEHRCRCCSRVKSKTEN